MVIWVRSIMWIYHLHDSVILDDPDRGSELGAYERREAERFKKLPSFADWFNYNWYTPLSWIGYYVDYSTFDDFINYRGNITKMSRYSNIIPALSRFIHYHFCF